MESNQAHISGLRKKSGKATEARQSTPTVKTLRKGGKGRRDPEETPGQRAGMEKLAKKNHEHVFVLDGDQIFSNERLLTGYFDLKIIRGVSASEEEMPPPVRKENEVSPAHPHRILLASRLHPWI